MWVIPSLPESLEVDSSHFRSKLPDHVSGPKKASQCEHPWPFFPLPDTHSRTPMAGSPISSWMETPWPPNAPHSYSSPCLWFQLPCLSRLTSLHLEYSDPVLKVPTLFSLPWFPPEINSFFLLSTQFLMEPNIFVMVFDYLYTASSSLLDIGRNLSLPLFLAPSPLHPKSPSLDFQ